MTAASFEPVPTEHFAGEWEGVYYDYPEPMALKMSLRQTGARAVEGEVEFSALTDSRNAIRPAAGRFAVRGEFDPALRTFALAPHAWIERPRRPMQAFALDGVMDAEGAGLAGLFGGRTDNNYFAFKRPQHARELTDPMTAAVGRRSGLPSFLFGGTPNDETLLRWATKLKHEYPDVDPRRTQMGQLYARAVNLFEDGHFSSHFGTTFDRMNSAQRVAVGGRFRAMLNIGRRSRPNESLMEYSALSRAFTSTGTQGTAEVVHAVLAQRVIRSWQMLQLARVERLPPTIDAIDELDRLQAAGQTRLRSLWPSDQAGFNSAVDGSRRRLAGPVLTVRAEHAVATATGHQGARALAGWPAANRRLIGLAPAAQRDAALASVETRLHEILTPLIAGETADIARLGRGTAAVMAGNRWYLRFQTRYGFAANSPAYSAAVRQLTQARPGHLAQAQRDVLDALGQISRPDDVDRLVGDILVVPGDRQTAAGRAIVAAADARKADIRRRQQTFATGAVSLMCHLGLRDANERRALVPAVLYGFCRRASAESIVKLNRPDLTAREVADVADLILQFVDLDFGGRQVLVGEITGELRKRHPQRNWESVALESLVEAIVTQAGSH